MPGQETCSYRAREPSEHRSRVANENFSLGSSYRAAKRSNTPARRPPSPFAGPALPAHNMHTTSPPRTCTPGAGPRAPFCAAPARVPFPPHCAAPPLCRRRWTSPRTSHSAAPVCGLPAYASTRVPSPRHRPGAGRARPAECDATGEARVRTPHLCSQRRPSHTHTYAPDCASGLAQCAEVLTHSATGHRAPREGRGSAAC